MKEFWAYHVVTGRPMAVGQHIVLDEDFHNGVWHRVNEKKAIVADVYANPAPYRNRELEHHTSVALRELAMEEVRKSAYPQYPSRMACLYASEDMEDARKWAQLFIQWKRPVQQIVKLKIKGKCFLGDANNCFSGRLHQEENMALARRYWENLPNPEGAAPILEMLISGDMEVVEIIETISPSG